MPKHRFQFSLTTILLLTVLAGAFIPLAMHFSKTFAIALYVPCAIVVIGLCSEFED